MKQWHDVASLEELEREGRVIARVGGREIGVLVDRFTGTLRAVRNRCPHQGSALCRGRIRIREAAVAGTPGAYSLEERPVLRCPHHGWEFDLETGRCPEDAAMRVAVYPVKVVDGHVLVEA